MSYEGCVGIVPLILNLGTKWRGVANFTLWLLHHWERTPEPTAYEAGRAPEPFCTVWRREKSLAPCV